MENTFIPYEVTTSIFYRNFLEISFSSFFNFWQPIIRAIVMTTASQQVNIPTWKEVIGNALLVEYELKFDVNFSQRKHVYFIRISCVCGCVLKEKSHQAKVCTFSL